MSFVGDLRHLIRGVQFRRLFAVRITSQFADGFFQVGLASYVLFSPERQPDAASIAAALAVVLLPMTVIGPFAGVFLDRWNRRQILALANVVRVVPVLSAAVIIATDGPEGALLVAAIACGQRQPVLPRRAVGLPAAGRAARRAGDGQRDHSDQRHDRLHDRPRRREPGPAACPWPGDNDAIVFVLAALIYLERRGPGAAHPAAPARP